MIKRVLIVCMVLLACHQPETTNPSKAHLDSLVWQMNNTVIRYYKEPTLDSMRNYINGLEETVRKSNSNKFALYWIINKAQLLHMEGKMDSIKVLMERAVSLSRKKDILQGDLLNFYIVYDGILKDQGLLDSAAKIAMEAYHLAKKVDTSRLTQTSLDLALIFQSTDDLPNLRKYALQAWQHSDQEPELKDLVATAISYYYERVGQLDSAIYFFKTSAKDSFLVNKPLDLAVNYENTAVFLNKQGKLSEGLMYQLKAKSIYDSLGKKDVVNFINLGETFGNLEHFNTAIAYLDSAIQLAREQDDYYMVKLAWKSKSAQLLKIPDLKKAYAALDSAYASYSVEVDSSLRQQARELETKYAVREKDNQIQNLFLASQANLKIRNQQKVIIIIIAIASLLLTVIGILFWRRGQIQMQIRETNLRQQLLRTQMEPHFLFNALGLLQSQIRAQETGKAIGYLNKLSRLIRFNFENARETLVLLRKEIEALDNYLNLQSIYKPGLFEYHLEVYEGYEEDDVYIPPMLLEPFIENAIYHAFIDINYKGMLTVKIEKSQSSIHCIIDDNGTGLQTSAEVNRPRSTAINQERLSILARQTGKPAKLVIIEKKPANGETGLRVEMDIPFLRDKGQLQGQKYFFKIGRT